MGALDGVRGLARLDAGDVPVEIADVDDLVASWTDAVAFVDRVLGPEP